MPEEEKERIIFSDPPKKKNKKLPKHIVQGVVISLLIVAGIFYLYVENITIYFSADNEIYHANVDGVDIYFNFSDGKLEQYLFAYLDDEREFVHRIGKITYSYSGYYWKKLIGSLYFSGNSFTSLENVETGAKPATVVISCKDFKIFDYFYAEIDTSSAGMIGQSVKYEIYFYEDGMRMDGVIFQKIEDFPDEIKGDIEFLDAVTEQESETEAGG